jgi:putative sterol carrier protein
LDKQGENMAINSATEVFEKMPTAFNAAAAAGLDVIYQFHISGAGGGDWNVVVKEGACTVEKSIHPSPNATISMTDSDWVALINGNLNPMTAFMTGKLKASGDLMAAQRIPSLFDLK